MLWFCWYSLVALGEIIFQKVVMNQPFWSEFCVAQQGTFYLHQDYEQVIFYKYLCLYIFGRSIRDGKVTISLQLVQSWKIIPNLDEIHFLYQHRQPFYDVMQKELDNLEFVQGAKLEFLDSMKNNGTKHFCTF